MDYIIQKASHICITNYTKGECRALERAFSYRDNWKTISIGMIYDEEDRNLLIFGGAKIEYIKYLTGGLPVRNDYNYDPCKKISIRLRNFPRDRLQGEMIQFLIGGGVYQYNNNCPQLSCNADTGEGKTFCAIAMMTYLRTKTIIIVNRVNIRDTWINEITKFTDIDKRRILSLDTKTIGKILEGEFDTSPYELFIVIHRTIANAAKLYGWKAIGELFINCGIGLKIYDEAHKEFTNTTHIDAYTNTRKTLYLTATLKISGRLANYIFQKVFNTIPKFDQVALGYNNSKKHITMIVQYYNSHPDIDDRTRCKTNHGFSSREYSLYQIERDNEFMQILLSNVEKMTVRNGFRSLILVSRIIACKEVALAIKNTFPKLKVGIYNSDVRDEEKKRVLKEDDVIVSTTQSLGMSQTIENLQWVCNCEAFYTDTNGLQASGRLRRLKGDKRCFYTELIDLGFPSIRNQWKARKKHYLEIFKEMIEIHLEREGL